VSSFSVTVYGRDRAALLADADAQATRYFGHNRWVRVGEDAQVAEHSLTWDYVHYRLDAVYEDSSPYRDHAADALEAAARVFLDPERTGIGHSVAGHVIDVLHSMAIEIRHGGPAEGVDGDA
jgi:hypothetical protein